MVFDDPPTPMNSILKKELAALDRQYSYETTVVSSGRLENMDSHGKTRVTNMN